MTTMMTMTMIIMVRMIGCEDVKEGEEMLRLASWDGTWDSSLLSSFAFVSNRVS